LASEGLLLFGIVDDEGVLTARPMEVDVVSLRDARAVVRRTVYRRVDATNDAIAEYRAIVETLHAERAVVPAPFGTVFRSRDSLLRWMELHYVALIDALRFLEDRAAVRIRVARAEGGEAERQDFETTVFDSFRFLKRNAVACVAPLGESGPTTAEASFLIERAKWAAFDDAVREERERLPQVSIEQTGPWPPYDFVRLRFEG
jgi:hypothetical protein